MKTYNVYLGDVYAYQGDENNTIEYRLVPISFNSITAKIDGEIVETHKPLNGDFYSIEYLQCRHLGNSWSQNNREYYSSIEKAKELINADNKLTFLRKTNETEQTVKMTFNSF